MSRTPLADGSLLEPRRRAYRIDQLIDAGTFGVTYRATVVAPPGQADAHPSRSWLPPGAVVVIKEFYPDFAVRDAAGKIVVDDPEHGGAFRASLQRFRREAERLCYLSCLRGLRAARDVPGPNAGRRTRAIDRLLARTDDAMDVGDAMRLLEDLDDDARGAAANAFAAAPLPIVHDYFTTSGNAYYVMEHLAGGTLKAVIDTERRDLGAVIHSVGERAFRLRRPWAPDRLHAFATAALDALEELHDGIPGQQLIHCDLKPGNIMFREPESTLPVLIDFGLTRDVTGAQSQTLLAGTGGYAPLEIDPVARGFYRDQGPFGGRNVGPWTDIYAMAAILRVLGTGIEGSHLPPVLDRAQSNGGPDPMWALPPFGPEHDPRLAAAVDHGLGIAIADRPASVAVWRGELGLPASRRGGDRTAPPVTRPQAGADRAGRGVGLWLMIALILLILAAIAGIAWFFLFK